MRRSLAGSFPDTFEERLRDGRCVPGEIGQYVNTAHGFESVGDSRRGDRFGWPIDHLASQCVFDWAAGDGDTPYIGPTLDITDGGGPDETDVSPWQLDTNANVLSAYFNGTTDRRTATTISAVGDHRLIVLGWPINDRTATNRRIFSEANVGGNGLLILYRGDVSRWSAYFNNPAGTATVSASAYIGWCLLDFYVDIDGNAVFRVNGSTGNNAAPGGPNGATDGVGIGSRPDGGNIFAGRIARVLLYHGADLDNAVDHNEILVHVFGAQNVQSTGQPTITRASAAVQLRDTHYHLIGSGAPRAGGDEGLLIDPTGTNKVYNNINPQATTGWSATGGTMSVVDDTTALRAAGLLEFGPNAHRFVPGAGDEITYSGSQTANVNPHSISLWIRGAVGGESVDVGVRDVSSGAMQNVQTVACTTGYQKVTLHGFVPGDTDRQFALDCDAGDTIYHIGDYMAEEPRCSSPIPNLATAATATRNFDDLVTADDPADLCGSVELTVTPVNWSANEMPGAIMYLTGSGNAALFASGGTWWAHIDGTTDLDSGVAPVDGTPHRIRLRWDVGSGIQSIEVWDATPQLLARVESAYDGTLYSAGTWELAGNNPSFLVTDFKTYRSGSG